MIDQPARDGQRDRSLLAGDDPQVGFDLANVQRHDLHIILLGAPVVARMFSWPFS